MTEQPMISIPSAPLPYYLESGQTRYAPGEQHPNRQSIGVYDIIVVANGILYIGEESMQWEVGPGQMLLLHPDRYHYAVRPCEAETDFYWLHFQTSGDQSSGVPSYTIRLPQFCTLPFPSQSYQRFEQLFRLSTARRSEAFWQEQSIFLEWIQQLDETRGDYRNSKKFAVAEMVEAYIKRNYQSAITNASLSADLHFHYNYLTRCMKEAYGVSPMEYLLQTRLEQAKLLLLKTDWSIARIAEHVGFEYSPYFSRCFSAQAGISPLHYRKRYSK